VDRGSSLHRGGRNDGLPCISTVQYHRARVDIASRQQESTSILADIGPKSQRTFNIKSIYTIRMAVTRLRSTFSGLLCGIYNMTQSDARFLCSSWANIRIFEWKVATRDCFHARYFCDPNTTLILTVIAPNARISDVNMQPSAGAAWFLDHNLFLMFVIWWWWWWWWWNSIRAEANIRLLFGYI